MTRGGQRRRRVAATTMLALSLALSGCGVRHSSAIGHHHDSTTSTVSTTTTAPVRPVDGKVTVLEVGDSLGVDLGWGMQWAFGNDPNVDLVQDAVGDTGLANVGYYNWPPHLAADIADSHPQVVVVFLGANDHQNFYEGNEYVSFGTALWKRVYGERVAAMIDEARAEGARVLWVGMPIMENPTLNAAMQQVDAVFRAETHGRSDVSYYSSWDLFATPTGQYNTGTTMVDGTPSALRTPDGVHLNSGGEDLLGEKVVEVLHRLWGVPS